MEWDRTARESLRTGRMGKKSKGNQRLDKFYYLAKEQGYRSRAAFKLVQLNRKYGFLEKARSCLDLCAAPGGWLQVAQKHMPMKSLVVGVDLDPIKPIKGVVTHQADITTERCRQLLRKEAKGGCYDIVIHDGAPNVGGNWASESHMQNVLVLESLKLACEFLPPNGWFVTKVFRSVDYHSLLYAFNQLFKQVEATKPMASRYQSAEIFVVCGGFKAPGKIDPRLLDAKHLFNDTSAEPLPAVDVLDPRNDKKKRQRQGYEDGISTTYNRRSVLDFVLSDAPVEMLGRTITFDFSEKLALEANLDKASERLLFLQNFKGTSEEIRNLCKDLPVLGRSDFKHLLKWRTNLRKAMEREGLLLSPKKAGVAAKADGSDKEAEEEAEVDEETCLLQEMKEVHQKMESRQKRDKKKAKKIKEANKVRIARSVNDEVAGIQSEQDLFAFHKSHLKSLRSAAVPGEDLMDRVDEASSDSEDEREAAALARSREEGRRASETAMGEDKDKYFDSQDKYFELLYRHYKGLKSETRFLKKRSRLDDLTEIEMEEMEQRVTEDQRRKEEAAAAKGKKKKGEEEDAKHASMAAKWFSQDVFNDIEADGKDKGALADPSESESEDDAAFIQQRKREQTKRGEAKEDKETMAAQGGGADDGEDFEIVKRGGPEEDNSSSDESDSVDSDDHEGLAQTMVLKKMFLKSKSKRALLDTSYNKYAFHDEGLPEWFAQDEAKHMRPALELADEDVAEARDQLKAIDSRTIKKVAEAKARKKRKLFKRMEAARVKANQIANSEDISARGKVREIGKLYANARDLRGGGKGGKGGKGGGRDNLQARERKGGKPLDRRMMADRRQVNMKQKKKDAKKAKRKGGGGGKGAKGRR